MFRPIWTQTVTHRGHLFSIQQLNTHTHTSCVYKQSALIVLNEDPLGVWDKHSLIRAKKCACKKWARHAVSESFINCNYPDIKSAASTITTSKRAVRSARKSKRALQGRDAQVESARGHIYTQRTSRIPSVRNRPIYENSFQTSFSFGDVESDNLVVQI